MFALTYCYEGSDNTNPYGVTIAVSTDIEKLKAEMEKCADEDCEIDEDDEQYIMDTTLADLLETINNICGKSKGRC